MELIPRLAAAISEGNLTLAEVAAHLQVDESTVSRWISTGKRPYKRNADRIEAFLASLAPRRVQETPHGYGTTGAQGGARSACIAYFDERVAEADASKNPHAWSHMLIELRRALPPGLYSAEEPPARPKIPMPKLRLPGESDEGMGSTRRSATG